VLAGRRSLERDNLNIVGPRRSNGRPRGPGGYNSISTANGSPLAPLAVAFEAHADRIARILQYGELDDHSRDELSDIYRRLSVSAARFACPLHAKPSLPTLYHTNGRRY